MKTTMTATKYDDNDYRDDDGKDEDYDLVFGYNNLPFGLMHSWQREGGVILTMTTTMKRPQRQ